MRDAKYFTNPVHDWQRRYEALRALLVDRLPGRVVAERFGYSEGYLRYLSHQFRHELFDFSEPAPEGRTARRRVTSEIRGRICSLRGDNLSAGEIAQLLFEEGREISVSTVERILAEEGYPRLPRRIRHKIGLTMKGASLPERSGAVRAGDFEGAHLECAGAGVFLFGPFLSKLDIAGAVREAGLPGTREIPALSYLLSFLALKLLGTERYSHVGDHAFDPGLGLFAGLGVLPKTTAMSTYSYSLDAVHIEKLERAFVKRAKKLGLYDGRIVNLDFHTVPHFGEESVLEKHWAGARGKVMKGALTLFAQDSGSKLILYTTADITKDETSDQALSFLSFWRGVARGVKPTLVFDSKFTTYEKLSRLDSAGVKFITLRRRGAKLIEATGEIGDWKRIHIPHPGRKFPDPYVHESTVGIKDYDGIVRQIIMKGNGHSKPAFIITNDFDIPAELVVGNYARRWRVENGIAEAVKFFNLNSLSSPILTKVHFDVAMTMVADTLYTMLAQKLRGFESRDAPKLYRHFVKGKGTVSVRDGEVSVTYPRRAHNPVLRNVPWDRLPGLLPGLGDAPLALEFK